MHTHFSAESNRHQGVANQVNHGVQQQAQTSGIQQQVYGAPQSSNYGVGNAVLPYKYKQDNIYAGVCVCCVVLWTACMPGCLCVCVCVSVCLCVVIDYTIASGYFFVWFCLYLHDHEFACLSTYMHTRRCIR
jgi:hypothetical protein